jgi:hypothetical protein
MPAAFTIRVTMPPGSDGEFIQEYFQDALHDENRAKKVVRIAAKLPKHALVEVVGEFRPAEIGKPRFDNGLADVIPYGRRTGFTNGRNIIPIPDLAGILGGAKWN